MAISPYLKELREKVGTQLLLVPSVGAIIRDDEGNILLQKVSFDERWSIPGGAIDPGETPEEAVVREVREETGLHVYPSHILAVLGGEDFRYTYPNGDQVEYHFPLFVCNIIGGELGGLDDETEELRFFPATALPELTLPYPVEIFRER
ncbi:MAG: NUDIX domain-containing protein [Ignavibacteriae bacterium]|nr:NUDIX domain-containing protein [Ignavibacteriota bacterium]MCB9214949.1 NUDIX domain-containing protein [Ignavibacteria bacterium]